MDCLQVPLNALPSPARDGKPSLLVADTVTRMRFVRLPQLCVVTVTGADSPKIANNLCTANVIALEVGKGVEAFVTEVRGKTLGHVCVFRTAEGLQLIGASGTDVASSTTADAEKPKSQAEVIVAHFDRYTLREKSIPEDCSARFVGFVLDRELAAKLAPDFLSSSPRVSNGELTMQSLELDQQSAAPVLAEIYSVPWWNEGAALLLVNADAAEACSQFLAGIGGNAADEAYFHQKRIEAAFPWYGVDLDASHLPQEADRDRVAISFTKGCYLGQETVARLDALGQVQKKLVRWNLQAIEPPAAGTELRDGDRLVGRITSVCSGENAGKYLAMGFARRSHFEPGSIATGVTANGSSIQAMVAANSAT
jgi:tRNA-modifying protein YgfZ